MRHTTIHLKLLATAALWGATWSWGRVVAQAMPPLTAATLRFALAALGLLAWLLQTKGTQAIRVLTPRQWLGLALAATFGIFGYALFFMFGLQYISAGKAAVVIAMSPALTLCLAAWFFKERLNARIITGILLAVGGATTAVTQGRFLQFFAGGLKGGELLIFGCVICWASYTLISRAVLKGVDALTATTITAAISAVMLAATSMVFEGGAAWARLAHLPATVWASLLALALGGTTVAYAWYFDGIKALGASSAAAYVTLVPIFGVAISALWLNEPLHASLLIGGLTAVTGMILMQWGQLQGNR